jgi:hypothetical protein
VTFKGTAGYTLSSADTGILFMVLMDQANQSLQLASTQAKTQVVKGSGQAKLSQTITLPATGITTVRLAFVLFGTGASTSTSSVGVSFAVK